MTTNMNNDEQEVGEDKRVQRTLANSVGTLYRYHAFLPNLPLNSSLIIGNARFRRPRVERDEPELI